MISPGAHNNPARCVGLIAGVGRLPYVFAENVRNQGARLVAIRAVDEAFVDGEADAVHSIFIGEWGRIVSTLKEENVDTVYVVGKLDRRLLFSGGLFDERFRAVMATIRERSDDAVVLGYVSDLEKEGLSVGVQSDYLSTLKMPPGIVGNGSLTAAQWADVRRAYDVAKAVSSVDAGQTAVVKDGAVFAIEAIDGTDETMRRAGQLGGRGAVAMKVSKPNQDHRFDLPVIGPETVQTAIDAGLSVLAFEARYTFVLDQDKIRSQIAEHNLILLSYEPGMEKAWLT